MCKPWMRQRAGVVNAEPSRDTHTRETHFLKELALTLVVHRNGNLASKAS
jgi:hypothetical protein